MTGKIDFSGKKVLITGASTGIGKALAYAFAGRGAHLALGSLPQEESLLNDVAKDIREAFHVDTWCFPFDLAAPEGPESLSPRGPNPCTRPQSRKPATSTSWSTTPAPPFTAISGSSPPTG